MNQKSTRKVLTAEEVAEALCVSRPTAYSLIAQESFPKIHIGRRVLVPVEGFDRWLREHEGEQVLQK